MSRSGSNRRYFFLLLCAGCSLVTIIYGITAARHSRLSHKTVSAELNVSLAPPPKVSVQPGTPAVSSAPASKETMRSEDKNGEHAASKTVGPPSAPIAVPPSTLLYFQANTLGDNYGKLSVAPLDALDRARYSTELSCDRLHFANGRGVCLVSDRGVFTTYYAVMFDGQLRRGWTIKLNGFPSRVRVSPSGRLAAITVFLSGHSYASLNFSTQTIIIDAETGEVLADLEKFSVSHNGAAFQSPDFNFWGVTFARDENRFYATLWSKGRTFLIQGDFASRAGNVIYEGVECPSLSPDGMRIAFKKRTGPISWRIWLLELKTLTEIPLGETRSVDDQVEWLDREHILYALSENEKGSSASTDIWRLPASINGSPQLLLKGAFSPAIVPGKN